jgi:A/G-specific adenine glycosylase
MENEFTRLLLDWYEHHRRVLPWRGVGNAYATWISEIMLQQTRVETVIPYYQRWMQRFPTLVSLAQASEQEVLHIWEGLGYYSRARNLYRAAQKVLSDYSGVIPSRREELEKLPGVGRYTSAAIASIAFGQDEAALDGNIRRVLARVFNMDLPARSTEGERRLWELARQNLPTTRAGEYNQALMDMGATICIPHNAACQVCPLAKLCQARLLGLQEALPVLKKRGVVPHKLVVAAVIQDAGMVLITRRPPYGLLGGLWEFPGGKLEAGEDFDAALRREIREELDACIHVGDELGVYQHAYTHFRITLHAFYAVLEDGEPRPVEVDEVRWVNVTELTQFPMGKVDRLIARRLAILEKVELDERSIE